MVDGQVGNVAQALEIKHMLTFFSPGQSLCLRSK